jgi:hypothetical protein
MAKHLSDRNIHDIIELLDGWREPLTWQALQDAVKGLTGQGYTRQALNSHERIRTAFAIRKNLMKDRPTTPTGSSEEMRAMQERIARLEGERARIAVENDRLLGQFATWAYNASIHGLNKEALNRPLPTTDRDRTNIAILNPQTGKGGKKHGK